MNSAQIQTAAVTSSMVTVATCSFAWSLTRWVDTLALHYTVPLVVTGTLWILTVVFASGVIWEMTAQLMARPPRPSPPPEKPGDTPRPIPSPIQPPRPKPGSPPRKAETTLVDMEPVQDATQEIPRVRYVGPPRCIHISQEELDDSGWRPPVSDSAKGTK